jgi:hypothetical protein
MVAHRVVANITTWSKENLGNLVEVGILNSWCESMLWMVTMLGLNVAANAKVVISTASAGNKILLGKFCDGLELSF